MIVETREIFLYLVGQQTHLIMCLKSPELGEGGDRTARLEFAKGTYRSLCARNILPNNRKSDPESTPLDLGMTRYANIGNFNQKYSLTCSHPMFFCSAS